MLECLIASPQLFDKRFESFCISSALTVSLYMCTEFNLTISSAICMLWLFYAYRPIINYNIRHACDHCLRKWCLVQDSIDICQEKQKPSRQIARFGSSISTKMASTKMNLKGSWYMQVGDKIYGRLCCVSFFFEWRVTVVMYKILLVPIYLRKGSLNDPVANTGVSCN